MKRTIDIELEFQPYIAGPPQSPNQMLRQSATNDEITIDTWKDTWINQTKANHDLRGPFGEHSVGSLFGSLHGQPCIVVGSGPSLKLNVSELAKASKNVAVVSCLHNFHFLEDNDVQVKYYVTLDAGPITITELSEGGKRPEEEYWALTKDRTLIAYTGSHPDLIKKWQGPVLWFTCPIPDDPYKTLQKIWDIEPFYCSVGTGGNVLGASLYIAKAVFCANPIVFVGADFGFSHDKKFHGWDSSYDKAGVGHGFKVTDIFGNRIYTWQSYYNFKLWMDRACTIVPGIYLNATEGGCLGAYPDGNIRQIQQVALSEVAAMYGIRDSMRDAFTNPASKTSLKLLF